MLAATTMLLALPVHDLVELFVALAGLTAWRSEHWSEGA